jgi:hypothetical protein
MSRDKVLALLTKLKAMAQQTVSGEEAAIAAEQMQKLMFKHKISSFEIAEGDADDIIEFDIMGTKQMKPTTWQARLASACAIPNFCKVLYKSSQRINGVTYKGSIEIIGSKSDIEAVTYLYDYILREMKRSIAGFRKDGYTCRTWVSSFRLGFINQVAEKILAMRKTEEAKLSGKCAALVRMADTKVADYIKNRYKTAKSHKVRRDLDTDGYMSGAQAGSKMNIRPALSSSDAKGIE